MSPSLRVCCDDDDDYDDDDDDGDGDIDARVLEKRRCQSRDERLD